MVTLEDVLEKIDEYMMQYRKSDLPELSVSGLYSLFPKKESSVTTESEWPHSFPNANKCGVYLILGEKLQVLYVGKASMNNTLGSRISSYFSYAEDKVTCKINSQYWSEEPKYIVTIAVPEGMSFEAPAIEEYLIKSFAKLLPDNTVGTKG